MADLFSGDFDARAVKPEIGAKGSKPVVRVKMEIMSDGPHRGKRLDYEGKLDEKNIKYTKQHMIALGWQGRTVATFVDDVMKAAKVVPVEVRIAEYTRDDGSVSRWSSIDRIGRAAAPLAPLAHDKVADVDSWFAEVGDVGAPAANGHGGGGGGYGGDIPPPSDGDLPF
jgi:hypothetical protein